MHRRALLVALVAVGAVLAFGVGTAPAREHELAHVAGTSALVIGGAVPTYLAYSVDWGESPPLAVALVLLRRSP